MQEEDDREHLNDIVDLAHCLNLVPFVGHETRPPDGHWIGPATVHLNVCCLCGFAVWPLPVNQEHVNCHLRMTKNRLIGKSQTGKSSKLSRH